MAAAAAAASISAAAQQEEHDKVEEASAIDDIRHFHRHHHHGGVMTFISMAAETLGLDPTKKAQVEKIRTDLQAKMAPARDAEHDLLFLTLADGIASGNIDTAKVDAAQAKVAAASAQIHTATGDALTQLHDALSASERQALVDKVKAHWEVWQKVNSGEKANSTEKGSHLEHMTKMLSLTPDQVTKITAALATDAPPKDSDPKPVDAYVTAFATAFTADKFDPKALAAPATAAAGHVARFGGARMAHFYEAVTPVLTPEQRTKLAAHLRERMNDHNAESTKPATPAPSAAPAGSK